MRICIYCLHQHDVSRFNKEHVLSQAFGTFEQNLTLDCVCSECNHYFSRTIELAYTRDSFEAFLRLHYGIKPAREVGDLGHRRLSITLGGDDWWNGCHIELTEEDGHVSVGLVPQVRFGRRSGGWVYVTEAVLADETKPLPSDIDTTNEIRLLSRESQPEMEDRLIALLATRGIPFTRLGYSSQPPPSHDGHAPLDLVVRFDSMIFGCVAKIAFNYMAWVAGADFVRSDSFDGVRKFIRYGSPSPYSVVIPHSHPILFDDTSTRRQTNGHLLTLGWERDSRGVVAEVSPFNEITYRVALTRNYKGLWRDIRSGHHFDIESRRVSRLLGTRLAR